MRKRMLLTSGAIAIALAAVLFLLPLPASLTREGMPESTRILDRHGTLLYAVQGTGLRTETPLENMPENVKDALLATEDRTFFYHPGLSLRGIIRAALRDIQAGKIVEGGSTITQQLVRTLLQPKKRGFSYKIYEAWQALRYDARFTKHDILERYLNVSFFGHGAYGIASAAKVYFDADVSSLSTAQSALLIGLLNAPSALNPFKDPEGARARRNVVLSAMLAQQYISQTQFESAIAESVNLSHGTTDIRSPHFVLWLLSEHPELRRKKTVTTTIDLGLQTATEDIVGRSVEKLREKNVSSASVVVLDARTGEILTMVGSADFFDTDNDGQVNVAVSSRQPGSALKPFTYALALSQGMTAATTIEDIEAQFFTAEGNPYVPRNYDYGFHGLVRLREALANSYNIAAVKVLEKVGIENLLTFLRRTGLSTLRESPEYYGLALTLGDSEVKLLELAAAYGIFARNGTTLQTLSYVGQEKTTDAHILDPKVAWLITDILSDSDARTAEFGTDGPLNFPYPVAAKTGTTRNSRDNWTIGYTPDRIVGVWVGNADNTPMRGTSGVTGAGPIFHDVMERAMSGMEKKSFERPDGIVDIVLCRLSGKLPTPLCKDRITEHFISGTEPHERDDIFVSVPVDTRNGLRSGPDCPSAFVQENVFVDFPPNLRAWADENGYKIPPHAFSPMCPQKSVVGTQVQESIVITRPASHASFLLDPLIPDDQEMIIFEARAGPSFRKLSWLVDGVTVGEGTAPDFRFKWTPRPGSFLIETGTGGVRSHVQIDITE